MGAYGWFWLDQWLHCVDSKSQYVYPFSGKVPKRRRHISTTIAVTTANSTDLGTGRHLDISRDRAEIMDAFIGGTSQGQGPQALASRLTTLNR